VIGAAVVTYNAPAATVEACLRSVRDAGGVDAIVLVDTGGRARLPADLAAIEIVRVPNRGYGAAVNAGWRRLRDLGADRVAVLNDDVVVRPGWVGALVAVLDGQVGVAQPVIVGTGDAAERVSSLGVAFDRYGAGVDIARGDPMPVPAAGPTPLDVFTGGAFVATDAFLAALGGFDERWFLYYEDADLACRGRELGWEYRLVTSAVVEHTGGVSTSTEAGRTRYLQERNRLWFAARHLPPATVGRAVWMSIRRLRHRPRRVHARTLVAGVAGMPMLAVERWRSSRVSGGPVGRRGPMPSAPVD
jgi:GT2 family glycosyltransferase